MWGAFLPAALGAGGMQLNLLVDLVLASFLDTGALSWLYYADRLAQLPLGIIGIALGTALLPRLSSIYADSSPQAEKQAQFASHISDSLTLAAITVLPAMTGLIILSDELMAGLFVSGAFTASDGSAAGLALVAYGVGLPAFVGIKITQAALYAMTRPQLVLIISLFSVGINIVLSLYLMRILGHVGLALATSISIWLSWAIQSVILFRQRYLDSQLSWPDRQGLLCQSGNGCWAVWYNDLRPADRNRCVNHNAGSCDFRHHVLYSSSIIIWSAPPV